jgi:formate-nitrite transporter family protein
MATASPEPDEIYRRTQEEGRRRLSRPRLELAATALVAGFDVVFGIAALGVAHHVAGELAGAVAFGVAFVFVVVGRSELFTENFLVPIAGLDRGDPGSWRRLGELWVATPFVNLAGGVLLALVLTTHGVLPDGTGTALVDVSEPLSENGLLAAFMSAMVAGALITLMTWLVEGADTIAVRVVVAWIVGALLALGAFNHVIVATLELFVGIRYGADIAYTDVASNFGIALAGNLVGGILFVTLTRFGQAVGSSGR